MGTLPDWLTAAATIAMFWIGWLGYKLAKQVQDQAEQQQKDFGDLLEAIVISNLLSGSATSGVHPGAWKDIIRRFKEKYKGDRNIFGTVED